MKKINIIPYLCFFLTGFASLIDEVLWTKILSYIFGSTLVATGFILFLYMIFLGIGSFIGGKISSFSKKPLKVFGIVEIIIGILTIITPYLFIIIRNISIKTNNILLAFLTFLILSPIIILMGTTFPIFLKSQRENFENYSKEIGIVYGLNLIGASFGGLFGGFLVLPIMGVKNGLIFAGLLDITAGFLAFLISKKYFSKEKEEEVKTKIEKEERISVFVVFFGGIASLTLEVVWFRCLSLFIGSSSYAFTLMVSSFILGLFFGSFFLSKKGDKAKDLFLHLSELHILIAFFSTLISIILISVPFFYIKIIEITSARFYFFNLLLFLFLLLLFLIPTSIMGTALPIAIKAGSISSKNQSKTSGRIYGFSSFGSSLGAILSSILFIPNFGIRFSALIAIIFSTISSFIANKKGFNLKGICLKVLFIIIILWLLWYINILPWDWRILTSGYYASAPIYATKNISKLEITYRNLKIKEDFQIGDYFENYGRKEIPQKKLLFLKEGFFSQVAVVEEFGVRSLLINGKADASNGPDDMRTQLLLAHLPSLFLKNIKGSACVIGLGSGVTAGALTSWSYDEIYVIEIEKEVLKASKCFEEENLGFYNDKRVKIIINDARKEIFKINKKFSIITSEPSNLWMSGTSSLFTYEFFKEISNKLQKDGIFCQWIHLYQISFEDVKTFLCTINKVFPYILVYVDGADMLLISSLEKIEIDPSNWIEKIKENEKFRYWMGKAGFVLLSDILKNFVMDEEGLKLIQSNCKIHKDFKPILEYSAAKWMGFNFSREILKNLITLGKSSGKIYIKDFGFIE